jgi:hypothetical protein
MSFNFRSPTAQVRAKAPECTGRSLKRQQSIVQAKAISSNYVAARHILGVQSLAIGVNPRAMLPVEGAGFQVAEVQGATINLQRG